jgi:6-phosphogluconate dehydrogenase
MTMQSDIGLIGLAVMGENLVLNMESKGFSVAVFNRTTAVTEKFVATRGKEKHHPNCDGRGTGPCAETSTQSDDDD